MRRGLIAVAAAPFLALAIPSPAAACLLPTIYFFEVGATQIDRQMVGALKTVAAWLQRNATGLQEVRVTGHSDRTGSRAARQAISVRRARAVSDSLVSYGAPARFLVVQGMSDRLPRVPTGEGVAEPDNRRVEIGISLTDAGEAALRAKPPVWNGCSFDPFEFSSRASSR